LFSDVTRLLLEHGADVKARDVGRFTPLHYAARHGRVEVARVLLEHVANGVAEDDDRKSVLYEYVNARGAEDKTSLHLAPEGPFKGGPIFSQSSSDVTRLLLEHGADVNARDVDRFTPLHIAARYGRVGVARVLLEHIANQGAEVDDRKSVLYEYVNARGAKDRTSLHLVPEGPSRGGPNIGVSSSEVTRLLLEHGADVKARDFDRFTPLHIAARYGRVEVARVLLEHGADVGEDDDDGKTASQIASEMGHPEITRLLSEHHRAEYCKSML
jgi:ankyrin repeat protein